ncbi:MULTISPECIES: exo-beta-N-acetylmuramidase NamZ family protein [Pseudoalteromonas]|uniref:DUF1343 domain-containing protein n=1 Tax=Pseudoalteromonas maricaloris TaxID=184924 RepID=A0A8I2KNB7_9GAMM|nr:MULTISPECIES: DUF1343 domain-containing protein [Pseudoalteromonas]KID36570.1 hypothetical protein QT15_08660 [Pseudoalteromonas flavipulchra NCIMB 2033 = ATCC BAA-314]MBD0782558.1 DUF1343 domain-containing protein [Pseudoalteromonas flavipulchra]MBE0373821.1 hypothetical protein [Pseudoalteromonas flavipulchra NCIMB 2033 = ATCC BAA-314]NLR24245.1 DUF1343 domain-containing protein [Pseudoalteromonas maricaloris]RZG17141.1 DUF1343 domain-containing protein [Pseudoalteromonas sp. CO342X]
MFQSLRICLLLVFCCVPLTVEALTLGAERAEEYLPVLKGKRVGLIVNQTSRVEDQHLVDYLLNKEVDVKKVFAPEHGFRGNYDAGAKVDDVKDVKTGLPIISLYGSNKKPRPEQLKDIDVLIFDIQDVGLRFYTYISTMHLAMEAAADANIEFWVFDRPNPNIAYVDGPLLEKPFQSFVGMHPIPVLHGMTVGELATMIKGEGWLTSLKAPQLRVFLMRNYSGSTEYRLPIPPSPNLPNQQAIYLYPSLCFFEATPISVGRGTDFPFQVFGYPDPKLGEFQFTPRPVLGAASNPKLNGVTAFGLDLRNSDVRGFDLTWFVAAYAQFKHENKAFFQSPDFLDKLAGTDKIRKAIESGQSASELRTLWQQDVQDFLKQRKKYLLYPRL